MLRIGRWSLVGNLVVGGCVIHKRGVLPGGDIHVHLQESAASLDVHVAVGIHCAVEGVVAKVVEIVCQEIVRLDVEVVAQAGEVLVMDEAVEIAGIAIDIADDDVVELYLGCDCDGRSCHDRCSRT